MKKSGIAGRGTVAVLASQPKKMTSRHEKMAGGRFSNCASAIELEEHTISKWTGNTHRDRKEDSRETQLGYDAWLIKGQSSRADCVEAPDSKEEPEPVILECILELLPIEVLVRRFGRVDGKSALDERLLVLGEPLHCRWD